MDLQFSELLSWPKPKREIRQSTHGHACISGSICINVEALNFVPCCTMETVGANINSGVKFLIGIQRNVSDPKHFYSASALLAMQSAVLARGILSVCLSVCPSVCLSVRPSVRPSVTFRYCVQKNEDTILRFSASGRTIPLVSGEVKFIRIFAGDHPQRGR